MNKLFRNLLLSLALLAGCGGAAAQTSAQRVTVPLSDPSRAGTLHVSLIHGSIIVKGTARKDLLIQVSPHTEDRSDEDDDKDSKSESKGLRQLAQPAAFNVEEENNKVEVSATNPRRGCDITIEVPLHTDLDLSTINGGQIQVEGVEGEHEIANVNGAITLDKVSGSVLAHTTNGAVKVALTRVTAGKPMAFTTLNGAVDLTLPANTKANLRLRSDNGQLFTDFDFTQQAIDVKETKTPGGGTMKEIGKVIGGAINGGGPVFELRSFNGNVYVRRGAP